MSKESQNPLKLFDENADGKKWYSEGLRFKCTQCGKCCTGAPGVVYVSEQELHQIAAYLQISIEEVCNRFVRKFEGALALKEKAHFDCIFLQGRHCTIYPVRPTQCRTFPWWPENLESRQAWQEAARHCEGINDEAPLISAEEIDAHLNSS
jgi:Fe-S-cluster containining protein